MRIYLKEHMKQARIACYPLILAAVLHGSISEAAELVLSAGIESGNYADEFALQQHPLGSVTTVKSPVRSGNYAVRAQIGGGTPTDAYRSEILPWTDVKPYWDKDEWWFGFSANLEDWPIGDEAWTLVQLHSSDWTSSSDCIKLAANAFTLRPADGTHLAIKLILNGGISGEGGALRSATTTEVWRTPIVKNTWQDFVLNFKLSDSGQGFWRIWHNGKLIYEKFNLTNVETADSCGVRPPPDKKRNYWKLGLYASGKYGPFSDRSVVFDSIKWAKGAGDEGYQLVAPEGGLAPPDAPTLQ